MPNTQFITLLIITVFSLLAGIVSAVVLFGQLNAKKRERAELERKLENAVGAAMNSLPSAMPRRSLNADFRTG